MVCSFINETRCEGSRSESGCETSQRGRARYCQSTFRNWTKQGTIGIANGNQPVLINHGATSADGCRARLVPNKRVLRHRESECDQRAPFKRCRGGGRARPRRRDHRDANTGNSRPFLRRRSPWGSDDDVIGIKNFLNSKTVFTIN